jgi:hypothetical protein
VVVGEGHHGRGGDGRDCVAVESREGLRKMGGGAAGGDVPAALRRPLTASVQSGVAHSTRVIVLRRATRSGAQEMKMSPLPPRLSWRLMYCEPRFTTPPLPLMFNSEPAK